MKVFTFSNSALNLPILSYSFGNSDNRILILGGVHGDEIEGVWASLALLKEFIFEFNFKNFQIDLVPTFNIDGVTCNSRLNGNGVDLNRNLPTKDWSPIKTNDRYVPGPSPLSESENKGLVNYIEISKPILILSLHSWKPMLNINGNCEVFAEFLREKTNYIITKSIGYDTPGCLGTFAGFEKKIPTLTYEIERGISCDKVIDIHVPAIIYALKKFDGNFNTLLKST